MQPENADLSIDITLSGMVISARLVQPENTPEYIPVRFFGKSTFESDVQPKKANSPIDVTLSGMVISARLVQYEKAYPPIDITLSGITMLVIPV